MRKTANGVIYTILPEISPESLEILTLAISLILIYNVYNGTESRAENQETWRILQ